MTPSLLVPIVVASLLGSVHCAGMCGGLVALATQGAPVARTQLAYHGARLVAYVTLGVLAGALGNVVDLAGAAAGLGRTAASLAGTGMALWGIGVLTRKWRPKQAAVRLQRREQGPFERLTARVFQGLEGRAPLSRSALLGGLSALLPCGWLYAFVLGAAATASPWQGALVMAAFWSGTVPLLVGLGLGVQRLLGPVRRHLPTLTACGLVAVGLFTVVGRGRIPTEAFLRVSAPSMLTREGAPSERAPSERGEGAQEAPGAAPQAGDESSQGSADEAPGGGCPFHSQQGTSEHGHGPSQEAAR